MKRIWPSALSPTLIALYISTLAAPVSAASDALTASVAVEEIRLGNGLTLLLAPRPADTTVAVGWMVQVGSADDPRGQAGASHLLEHMMFKGSRTVGTRDLDQELLALEEVDRLWVEKRDLDSRIASASPKKKQRLETRRSEVVEQLQAAQSRASRLAFLGHYSFLYSQQGGTDLNANTYRDLTLYYVTLPTEKLELWFWLESDRLVAPVFREFYKEIQVVHQERRQRIESTPTGRLDEEVRALFWGDHPYARDPMGTKQDLDRLTRQDALDFYSTRYRADRMTLALVGGFDVDRVKEWAQRYFGRLPASSGRPFESPATQPVARAGEVALEATCSCPPQVRILYPSARFGEPDAYALQLLSAVLNGRAGRLYRSLVVDQQIAFSAYTQQISWRQAGEFSFRAESKGDHDPQKLVDAWDRQLRQLLTAPPTADEIERAVNRSTADGLRAIKEPVSLLKQILIYQGLGDWHYLNDWSVQIDKLGAEDLVRVAETYLTSQHRTVAIYRRAQEPTQP